MKSRILTRYEIFTNGESHGIGFIRGLEDTGISEDVKSNLLRWDYSEEVVEYAVAKWAENPPLKTEIDWFRTCYETLLDYCNNTWYINDEGCVHEGYLYTYNSEFTYQELEYAMNRLRSEGYSIEYYEWK